MSFRQRVAKLLAPNLLDSAAVQQLVAEEIKRAKMALPITASYDPHGEGYRPLSNGAIRRDMQSIDQGRMFEIAYYMFDASAMLRRLAVMDRGFLFAGKITVRAEAYMAQEVIDAFWDDTENNMDLNFPDLAMWLSLLGEQCWPVEVNPTNGFVRLGYTDPSLVREIYVNPYNVRQMMQAEIMGTESRGNRKLAIIRRDNNIYSKTYGRLVGECFFNSINHPPNSPRGRSDFLTLFDWIDGLERHGFNYLERSDFMMNFVWDVMLKGMTEEQIKEWVRNNPPPDPGSIRAHNEQVEWTAVAPDIKAQDFKSGFDMAKQYIMGAAGRPDSWFGAGGKAYQTEADLFGQVPISDMEQRQKYLKSIITTVIQFVLDQAVIAKRLSPAKADAGFTVNMPEVSKKDTSAALAGITQVAAALTIAETNRWISRDTATKFFANVSESVGYEIDAEAEIQAAKAKLPDNETDYDKLIKE
jgi:hypothetical protein